MWGQINKKTLKCSLWSHLLSQKKNISIRKFKPQQLTKNDDTIPYKYFNKKIQATTILYFCFFFINIFYFS